MGNWSLETKKYLKARGIDQLYFLPSRVVRCIRRGIRLHFLRNKCKNPFQTNEDLKEDRKKEKAVEVYLVLLINTKFILRYHEATISRSYSLGDSNFHRVLLPADTTNKL